MQVTLTTLELWSLNMSLLENLGLHYTTDDKYVKDYKTQLECLYVEVDRYKKSDIGSSISLIQLWLRCIDQLPSYFQRTRIRCNDMSYVGHKFNWLGV